MNRRDFVAAVALTLSAQAAESALESMVPELDQEELYVLWVAAGVFGDEYSGTVDDETAARVCPSLLARGLLVKKHVPENRWHELPEWLLVASDEGRAALRRAGYPRDNGPSLEETSRALEKETV